ncbi:MAG: DUF4129 domain-containing protein [Chloroflexi bacterium]|nr:DUF4129 domain-containing protein [Chloroflexota bacterium]
MSVRSVFAADLESYRRALQQALADVDRGGPGWPERVSSRVRALDSVTLADGQTIRPDNAGLLADLAARAPNRTAVRARLRSLLAELDATSHASTGHSIDRAELDLVLQRPEFRNRPFGNPLTELLEGLWLRFLNWLASRFGGLPSASSEPGPAQQAIPPLAALLGMLLILWIAWQLRWLAGRAVVEAPKLELAVPPTSRTLLAEAEQHAAAGRFRAAIRSLYFATLVDWEERSLLRFDRSLTNREVLARARAHDNPQVPERLAPLVERFDRFWYGGKLAGAGEYREFAQLAGAARELA